MVLISTTRGIRPTDRRDITIALEGIHSNDKSNEIEIKWKNKNKCIHKRLIKLPVGVLVGL